MNEDVLTTLVARLSIGIGVFVFWKRNGSVDLLDAVTWTRSGRRGAYADLKIYILISVIIGVLLYKMIRQLFA